MDRDWSLDRRRFLEALLGAPLAWMLCSTLPGCASTPEEDRREAGDALRDYLREHVDPTRQERALQQLDALEAELATVRAELQQLADQLAEQGARYETTADELLATYRGSRARRSASRERLLDLHMELSQALSPEERAGFAERELELLRASLPRPRTGAAAGAVDEEG